MRIACKKIVFRKSKKAPFEHRVPFSRVPEVHKAVFSQNPLRSMGYRMEAVASKRPYSTGRSKNFWSKITQFPYDYRFIKKSVLPEFDDTRLRIGPERVLPAKIIYTSLLVSIKNPRGIPLHNASAEQ